MTRLMLSDIEVRKNILQDPKYQYLFSVEEVNKLVLQGVPFRDAYQQVGRAIEKGEFRYSAEIKHSHAGSIGNLCNEEITRMMDSEISQFQFELINDKLKNLLG